MKNKVMLIIIVMLIAASNIYGYKESGGSNKAIIQENISVEEAKTIVNETVKEFDKINVKYTDVRELFNFNEESAYYLFYFNDSGYAIIGKKNKVIYEYAVNTSNRPYEEYSKNEELIYGGPLKYYSVRERSVAYDPEYEEKILNMETHKQLLPMSYSVKSSVGIPISRMIRYSSNEWKNNKYFQNVEEFGKGICGTIASAIMLAYFQDYIDESYVPDVVRSAGSESPERLIKILYGYIDRNHPNGTIPMYLTVGISSYFNYYGIDAKVTSSVLNVAKAKKEFSNKRPVVVSVGKFYDKETGYLYQNHWVTAYQSNVDKNGNEYYLVNDNLGNYMVRINVDSMTSLVYIK